MAKEPVIQVRGYHLDVYGHVNNARYLEFLEEGRWAMFDGKLDLDDWRKNGLSFYVVNININYRKAAVLGDTIRVESKMARIGNKSGTIRQDIVLHDNGTVCVEADVVFVIVDESSGRAVPLEGKIREIIAGL